MTASLSGPAILPLVNELLAAARRRRSQREGDDRPGGPRRSQAYRRPPAAVLSVSARQADVAAEGVRAAPRPGAPDAAAILRLLDAAEDQAARLQRELQRAAGVDLRRSQSVVALEERLSIGAQMLTAFEAQIERLEHNLELTLAAEERNRALLEEIRLLLATPAAP